MPINATRKKLVTSRIDPGIDPYRVEELFGLETADPIPPVLAPLVPSPAGPEMPRPRIA
jgi:hypothetical protein